jgi:hypothetical protein
MKSDREIHIARELIHRHGLRAAAVAREHAQQSTAQNDCEAAVNWAGIARTVEQLRAEGRSQPSAYSLQPSESL